MENFQSVPSFRPRHTLRLVVAILQLDSRVSEAVTKVGHWMFELRRDPTSALELWEFRCGLCGYRTRYKLGTGVTYVLPLTGNLRDRRRRHDREKHPETLKEQGAVEQKLLTKGSRILATSCVAQLAKSQTEEKMITWAEALPPVETKLNTLVPPIICRRITNELHKDEVAPTFKGRPQIDLRKGEFDEVWITFGRRVWQFDAKNGALLDAKTFLGDSIS